METAEKYPRAAAVNLYPLPPLRDRSAGKAATPVASVTAAAPKEHRAVRIGGKGEPHVDARNRRSLAVLRADPDGGAIGCPSGCVAGRCEKLRNGPAAGLIVKPAIPSAYWVVARNPTTM